MITLAKKDTAFGEITILQRRAIGSHIYCQERLVPERGRSQRCQPDHLRSRDLRPARADPAREVLMIGCGGGTLATMLVHGGAARYRRRYQSAIDRACAAVFLFAYACHLLRRGWRFLSGASPETASMPSSLTPFTGDRLPPIFARRSSFSWSATDLAPSGCVFFNVFLHHGSDPNADVIARQHGGRRAPGPCPRAAGADRAQCHRHGRRGRRDLRPPSLLVAPEVLKDEITARA